MLVQMVTGESPDKPRILGNANGEDAIQVYATGLFEGLRAGDTRWVSGDAVKRGIRLQMLVPLGKATPEIRQKVNQTARNEAATGAQQNTQPDVGNFRRQDAPDVGAARAAVKATAADKALAAMSKSQLYDIARKVGLHGRTSMDKDELYDHLRKLAGIESYI